LIITCDLVKYPLLRWSVRYLVRVWITQDI